MRRALVLALLAAAAVPGAAGARGSAGTPDPAFGRGGLATLVTGEAEDVAALLPDHDGVDVFGVGEPDSPDAAGDNSLLAAAFTAAGRPVAGYGMRRDAGGVAGAVREGGRTVLAVNEVTGDPLIGLNSTPPRVTLLGLDGHGHADRTFGVDGSVGVAATAEAVGLLRAPDGTLRVAGFAETDAGRPTALLLVRLTADGRGLDEHTIPLPGLGAGTFASAAAVELADGSTVVVGADPRLFMARFGPDGRPDATFGAGGLAHLDSKPMSVSDATVDPRGRLLVAGAEPARYPATRPVLLRLTPGGAVDASLPPFGHGRGRGTGPSLLTGVRTARSGSIYVSRTDGRVARLDEGGRPDLTFGVGGLSVAPPRVLERTGALTLDGATALVGGMIDADEPLLAVERVRTAGTAPVPPVAGRRVVVRRRIGRAGVLVPYAHDLEPLTRAVALALVRRRGIPDDPSHPAPVATEVEARGGTVQLTAADGRATVAHGRVALYRAGDGIPQLDLLRPACGAAQRTTVETHGPFVLSVGPRVLRTARRRTVVTVRRGCHGAVRIAVRAGRVTRRTGPVAVTPVPAVSDGVRYYAYESVGHATVVDDRTGRTRAVAIPPGCAPDYRRGGLSAIAGGRLLWLCKDAQQEARAVIVNWRTGHRQTVTPADAVPHDYEHRRFVRLGRRWIGGDNFFYGGATFGTFRVDIATGRTVSDQPGGAAVAEDLDRPSGSRALCPGMRRRRFSGGIVNAEPTWQGLERQGDIGLSAGDPQLDSSVGLPIALERCGRHRPVTLAECGERCDSISLGSGLVTWAEEGDIGAYSPATGRSHRLRAGIVETRVGHTARSLVVSTAPTSPVGGDWGNPAPDEGWTVTVRPIPRSWRR